MPALSLGAVGGATSADAPRGSWGPAPWAAASPADFSMLTTHSIFKKRNPTKSTVGVGWGTLVGCVQHSRPPWQPRRKADLGSRRPRQPLRTTLCAHAKTMNSRCYLDHFESLKETAQHSGFQFSHVHSHSDFSLGNAFRASTLNCVKQYT